MIVMATEMQEQEVCNTCAHTHTQTHTHTDTHTKIHILQVGDGTNLVLVFSGALLEQAENLLKMGLSPSDVIEGYEMASTKALEILPCKFIHILIVLQYVL